MNESQEAFLVFSDDWGEHPSSCQHIFKHIVKEYPVVWVNTVGMRLPRLCKQDALKAIKKIQKMVSTISRSGPKKDVPPNLSVLQPFMVPYNKGLFRKFNKHSVIKTVKKELDRRNIKNPILVTTVPNACDYIGAFNEKKVVYYCVDDFANWPGHDKELVQKMEEDLIKKSDLFIATSGKLYKYLLKFNKKTYILSHGVDIKSFKEAPETIHPFIKAIRPPRLGYVGLIDQRLDWDLIKGLLMSFPYLNFVFVGRTEIDLSSLRSFSNFYYLPPIPYNEIPLLLKNFDILILPYKVDKFTESINPLKLKEYLASGRKIIGAPLPEIEKYGDFLVIALNFEDWKNKIAKILVQPQPGIEKRLSFLSREDWSFKAQEFLNIIFNA